MPPRVQTSAAALEPPGAAWARELARRLLAWYRRHRRELPWRASRDPYRVWISEIMLQQTQVATVIPYFARFVAAFPDAKALAGAEERDVLRLWEGLGYYRRARQLHQAARIIASQHAGRFPRALAEVAALPGIGRYTAGAIVSIAYDRRAPILEANTVRLYARLAGFAGDPATTAGRKALWAFAEAIVPQRRCGDFNQALMELGSRVCTPKAPACNACPVQTLCAACRLGRQDQIPRRAGRPRIEAVREAAVVAWRGDKVFVRQRLPGERWAGLWDFLRFPLTHTGDQSCASELIRNVREQAGLEIATPRRFATLKHGVTRFRITLDCYHANARGRATLPRGQWQWINPAALAELPLSATGRKLSRMLLGSRPL